MTTRKIDGVAVTTEANVYFFSTGAPETMEGVAGSCEYRLDGTDTWVKSGAGEKFNVPGNSKFDIRVAHAYHYICHFG